MLLGKDKNVSCPEIRLTSLHIAYFKNLCCSKSFVVFSTRKMAEVKNALKEAKKAMKDNDFEAVSKHCKVSGECCCANCSLVRVVVPYQNQ